MKEAKNIELPHADTKLVVVCFLSPEDSILSARVYKTRVLSQVYKENDDEQYPDATVELSHEQSKIFLTYQEEIDSIEQYASRSFHYKASTSRFPILPGKTYHLKVTTPDGFSTHAITTIPADRVLNFDFISRPSPQRGDIPGEYKNYEVDIEWVDLPGQQNYYRAGGILYDASPYTSGTVYFEEPGGLVDDRRGDGNPIRLKNGQVYSTSPDAQENTLVAYLFTCDRHYYQYHKNLTVSSGDNPFAESVAPYTNVEGGLGVFGSYRISFKTISIPSGK